MSAQEQDRQHDGPTHRRIMIKACDTALYPFLRAESEREADRCLDRLQREFISTAVNATLASELRRSEAVTLEQLEHEAEIFQELSIIVSSRIAIRLRQLRQDIQSLPVDDQEKKEKLTAPKPIVYLTAYAVSATKNAIIDYLRHKYPGRRSLDTALQAAFLLSDTLSTWKVKRNPDFEELRCGQKEWRDSSAAIPITPLAQTPDLIRQLRSQLYGLGPAQAVEAVFQIINKPLLYDDLLAFLADLWDVEAPYRTARQEWSQLRAPRLTASPELQPEQVALRIGTLQEVWSLLIHLSAHQLASILLHLPFGANSNFLGEFTRLGVASEEEIAARTGIPVDTLQQIAPELPLDDSQIAALLGVETHIIRRIRQDARRRLVRLLGRTHS